MNAAHAGKAWVVSGPQKAAYDNVFETLQRNGDKATGMFSLLPCCVYSRFFMLIGNSCEGFFFPCGFRRV